MRKHVPAKTIIQQIQPQCDTLHIKMKHQKDARHETNQSVADGTGIPISNVAKFFSGSLANPSVFYVAAICIYLHLSLDCLFEITPPKKTEAGTNVAELQAKLDGAEKQVALLKERSELLESGIKERKPVIYGLAGLCIFLTVALLGYIVMDINDREHGFFTANGFSVKAGVMCISVVVVVLALLHFIAKIIVNRRREKH